MHRLEELLGTIEPVRVTADASHKEFGGIDKLGFIRGCIKKYRGKGAHDSEILDYIEKQLFTVGQGA